MLRLFSRKESGSFSALRVAKELDQELLSKVIKLVKRNIDKKYSLIIENAVLFCKQSSICGCQWPVPYNSSTITAASSFLLVIQMRHLLCSYLNEWS